MYLIAVLLKFILTRLNPIHCHLRETNNYANDNSYCGKTQTILQKFQHRKVT